MYVLQEGCSMVLTLLFVLSFMFHKFAQLVHLFVDDLDGRMRLKELIASGSLLWCELFGVLS